MHLKKKRQFSAFFYICQSVMFSCRSSGGNMKEEFHFKMPWSRQDVPISSLFDIREMQRSLSAKRGSTLPTKEFIICKRFLCRQSFLTVVSPVRWCWSAFWNETLRFLSSFQSWVSPVFPGGRGDVLIAETLLLLLVVDTMSVRSVSQLCVTLWPPTTLTSSPERRLSPSLLSGQKHTVVLVLPRFFWAELLRRQKQPRSSLIDRPAGNKSGNTEIIQYIDVNDFSPLSHNHDTHDAHLNS